MLPGGGGEAAQLHDGIEQQHVSRADVTFCQAHPDNLSVWCCIVPRGLKP
jgi:hypothetical protein